MLSFLKSKLSNLTSKIIRETEESIKKLCLNTSKVLRGLQDIDNQLDSFFAKGYKNQEIHEKMSLLLNRLNPEISGHIKDFQKPFNLLTPPKTFIRIPVKDYSAESLYKIMILQTDRVPSYQETNIY